MIAALLFHGLFLVFFLGVYGRWLDEEVVADVCLLGLLFELLIAALLTQYVHTTDVVFYLHSGSIFAGWFLPETGLVFSFDELSGVFLCVLVFALILCFFFLVEYFEFDTGAGTIFFLSALFSQTALLYFSANDLCFIIFLWEAISLVSFLLVQHWSFRLTSFKAGLKVFTVSQFGDFPLFIFFFILVARVGSSDVLDILASAPLLSFEYLSVKFFSVAELFLHLGTLSALLLQVAVFLKAAQWFFYPWLLDAMEAPVPISAQLHSSTLVVIGFYLFFRFQTLFDLAPLSRFFFLAAGLLTSVGASVLGFYQEDGKKLLACSTAGQLGYVVTALGLTLYGEALCLLVFCCCNKALTFVWFGVVMRRFSGISDFRCLAGQSLSWFEHAGLAVAVANFTIFPGAFCWHVKGLFALGFLPWNSDALGCLLGLGLLQLTWFLSSLYLWALYLVLFFGPSFRFSDRRRPSVQFLSTFVSRQQLRKVPSRSLSLFTHQTSSTFCLLLWGALFVLVWFGGLVGLLFLDTLWVDSLVSLVALQPYY